MNILMYIRNILINDDVIQSNISNRVYFYEVTENVDTTKPFVIISPVIDDVTTYVSDKYLAETYQVQIDVETYKDQLTVALTKRIRFLMWENGFQQASTQLDEYFKETKRYVKSRRYEGIPKNQYYKGERIE
ncbi:hypothetical protein ACFY3K_00605 [Staphylococcus capitis]|uniref:hypothetical protein n=1 Tax=Staphylococcus capitis TaxID=29388 RepID=UPI00368E88A7